MPRRPRVPFAYLRVAQASRLLGDGLKLLLSVMHGYDLEPIPPNAPEGCYLSAPHLADRLGWTTARAEHLRRDLVTLGLLSSDGGRRGRAGGRYFLTPQRGTLPSTIRPKSAEIRACAVALDAHLTAALDRARMARPHGANPESGMVHLSGAISVAVNGENPAQEWLRSHEGMAPNRPATDKDFELKVFKDRESSELNKVSLCSHDECKDPNAATQRDDESGNGSCVSNGNGANRERIGTPTGELERQLADAERARDAATDAGERRYYAKVAENRRRSLGGAAATR